MKRAIPVFVAVLAMSGCATSSYSFGRDFPSTNVAKIEKNKTTAAELRQLFGEPFSKSPMSDVEEKWVWTYTSGKAHAQSFIVATSVKTTGQMKTLDVLLRDGVVTNFTFTEGPAPTVH